MARSFGLGERLWWYAGRRSYMLNTRSYGSWNNQGAELEIARTFFELWNLSFLTLKVSNPEAGETTRVS